MRARPPATLVMLARALPALLVWAAAGCEALVDGTLADVRCSQEGAVGPPACPAGYACKSALCVPVPSELGTFCEHDADCASGDFCLLPAAFGGEGPRRCSRACCTSTDCDPLDVCWNAPRGAGSFCRAAPDVGRAQGGTRRVLETCRTDADCRSGRCADRHCADTCCSNTGCADQNGACRFGAAPAHEADGFWCSPPTQDQKPRYASCATDAECASGLCVVFAPGAEKRCSVPCCGSAECEEIAEEKGTPVACAPVLVGSTWVRACSLLVTGHADVAVGDPCTADSDCRSGFCDDLGGAKRCSDACCSDGTCGDPFSFACRPVGKRASWALRCEPK